MKKILTPLLFVVLALTAPAEKLTYSIVVFGKTIGSVIVEKNTTPDGNTVYKLTSSTVSNFFFITRTTYQNYVVDYREGQLMNVKAINTVNKDLVHVKIEWNGSRYNVTKNNVCYTVNEPVKISTLTLYFNKPGAGARIFSERLGEFYGFSASTDSTIEYALSDGIKNIFYYRKGIVEKIEMKKSFITVNMILTRRED